MKRAVLVAFCIIALCSLGLVMKTGTVSAPYQTGYEVNDYIAITTPLWMETGPPLTNGTTLT